MTKSLKNNVAKVYCEKCNLVFESRKQFEKHLDAHSSNFICETCPIDTVIAKFVKLFKRKPSHDLE